MQWAQVRCSEGCCHLADPGCLPSTDCYSYRCAFLVARHRWLLCIAGCFACIFRFSNLLKLQVAIAQAEAIPHLCRLLQSPGRVGAQAADCLQLLCTNCCEHAWACVKAGAVDQLVLMLKRFGCQSNAARCIWTLAATHALVKEAFIRTGVIPLLARLLSRDNDPEVRHLSAGGWR